MTTPNNFATSNAPFSAPNAVETPTERPTVGKMKDALDFLVTDQKHFVDKEGTSSLRDTITYILIDR